jgi:outer membrane PBP1 activator LpoA protein
MFSSRTARLLLLLGVVFVSLLNGCGTGVREAPPVSSAEQRLRSQAQSLEKAGDYQGAAALYLQAAEQVPVPLRQDYLISGADELVRAGEYDRAAGILAGITPGGLPEAQQPHYNVVQARLDLAQHRAQQALERLQPMPAGGPWQADYHRLRAEAYALDGNYLSSARERIALDGLLGDPRQKLENQLAIWGALTHLSDAQLREMRLAPPPDVLSGWVELVELTRLYLQQPQALADVIPRWQTRYPGHPAAGEFTTRLLQGMGGGAQPPPQVAVLLPLTGSLAIASTAIRDGILAAYYDTAEGERQPVLRFYDVGANPADAAARYQQAVADGARFVIGPLRKEAVQSLLQPSQLPVPLLTLNTIDSDAPANPAVYQFGLAPEDEARDAARRAWQDGHRRAISLTPEGDWGDRVEAAFADEWSRLGGILLDHPTYDPAQTDHSRVISAALHLDASKARQANLVRLLGRQLEFEPRRRQDVDFIFLLATPEQARLIRPQLSFFRAQHVPVYSTSHVYTGRPDRSRDFDLDGIRFCDMPWLLEAGGDWQDLKQSIAERWPDSAASNARLYALGVDAYRIIPYLGRFKSGLFGAYHGVTGNLTLDDRQVLHRALVWAQFRNGLPVLIDAGTTMPAETDTPAPAQ